MATPLIRWADVPPDARLQPEMLTNVGPEVEERAQRAIARLRNPQGCCPFAVQSEWRAGVYQPCATVHYPGQPCQRHLRLLAEVTGQP